MHEQWLGSIPTVNKSPWFLLTQGDKLLDVKQDPVHLAWDLLRPKKDFKVFLGVLNEFNTYEVIGPCATYHHNGNNTWRLTSRYDNYARLVGITGLPSDCISNRLDMLNRRGYLNDPTNYERVILEAC